MVEFGSLFRAFKKPAEVAGAGALAASIAACGGGEAPKTPNTTPATPSPIVTPGEMPSMTPSPSFEVTPSPVVTPSPTVEATPSPTPEIKPIGTITNPPEKPKPVTVKTVNSDIETLYTQNPQAKVIYPNMEANKKTCETSAYAAERKSACNVLVFNLFRIYQQTGDENAYKAAQDTYNWATGPNGVETKAEMDTFLAKVLPQ